MLLVLQNFLSIDVVVELHQILDQDGYLSYSEFSNVVEDLLMNDIPFYQDIQTEGHSRVLLYHPMILKQLPMASKSRYLYSVAGSLMPDPMCRWDCLCCCVCLAGH